MLHVSKFSKLIYKLIFPCRKIQCSEEEIGKRKENLYITHRFESVLIKFITCLKEV